MQLASFSRSGPMPLVFQGRAAAAGSSGARPPARSACPHALSRSTQRSRARGRVPGRTTPASSSAFGSYLSISAHARHRAVPWQEQLAKMSMLNTLRLLPSGAARQPVSARHVRCRAPPHGHVRPCSPLTAPHHHPLPWQPIRAASSKSRRPMTPLSPPSQVSRTSVRRAL